MSGYVTFGEEIRSRLTRKRRLRMIYKWRNGLPHSTQPSHRDASKRQIIEFYDTPISTDHRVVAMFERAVTTLSDGIARTLMGG